MRPCPLCRHPDISQINSKMIHGTDAREIARDYRVPWRSALHHRRYHLPRLLQKVREVDQQLEATALRKMLVEIGQEMRALYETFKKTKDFRGAIVALDKLLGWWQTTATMVGIAEPPEGRRDEGMDVAQAARDLFGITEMPELPATEGQRALPAADAAPQETEQTPAPDVAPPQPKPQESAAARYKRTQKEIQATTPDGNWQISRDPDLAERVKRARPVEDTRYQRLLDQAHREGRRLEPGEASPHMLGWDVDLKSKPN